MIVGVEDYQDDGAMIRSGRIIPFAPGLIHNGKQRNVLLQMSLACRGTPMTLLDWSPVKLSSFL